MRDSEKKKRGRMTAMSSLASVSCRERVLCPCLASLTLTHSLARREERERVDAEGLEQDGE